MNPRSHAGRDQRPARLSAFLLTAQREVAALGLGEPLLGFIDDLEQYFDPGVGPLRVAPPDTYPCWLGRVRGEHDPSGPSAWIHGVGPTADDHVWIQALNRLCERVQVGALHLGAGTKHPDGCRDHLSVSEVFVFECDQDPRRDQLLLGLPSSTYYALCIVSCVHLSGSDSSRHCPALIVGPKESTTPTPGPSAHRPWSPPPIVKAGAPARTDPARRRW
jgi:hypothetical protein